MAVTDDTIPGYLQDEKYPAIESIKNAADRCVFAPGSGSARGIH